MNRPLSVVVTSLGGILIAVGSLANRYHHHQFQTHIQKVRSHVDNGRTNRATEEIRRFNDDRWMSLAEWAMLVEPLGFVLVTLGVVLWLEGSL